MSRRGVVRGLGIGWVRMYTAGLPHHVRARRRGEIESDMFEQERAAVIDRGGIDAVTGDVASRFVRGVPSDISWRIGYELDATQQDPLAGSWLDRIAVGLVLAIALTSLVYAVLHTFGYFGEHRVYAFIQLAMIAGCLILLGGMSSSRQHPLRGGAQVLVSGLAIAFMWGFMLPIAVAMLIVTAYGVFRAYRFGRKKRRDEARTSRGTPA